MKVIIRQEDSDGNLLKDYYPLFERYKESYKLLENCIVKEMNCSELLKAIHRLMIAITDTGCYGEFVVRYKNRELYGCDFEIIINKPKENK